MGFDPVWEGKPGTHFWDPAGQGGGGNAFLGNTPSGILVVTPATTLFVRLCACVLLSVRGLLRIARGTTSQITTCDNLPTKLGLKSVGSSAIVSLSLLHSSFLAYSVWGSFWLGSGISKVQDSGGISTCHLWGADPKSVWNSTASITTMNLTQFVAGLIWGRGGTW